VPIEEEEEEENLSVKIAPKLMVSMLTTAIYFLVSTVTFDGKCT
jgi:hypothetical protein